MQNIPFIDSGFIQEHTRFKVLINEIRKGFASPTIETPQRHHHNYSNPPENKDSTLLIMPVMGYRKGYVVSEKDYGPFKTVILQVEGTAYNTEMHTFAIDPKNPIKNGFILR